MSLYVIKFASIVAKQVGVLSKKDAEKIKMLISELQNNPRPFSAKKLVGGDCEYRIRYRDWRILYTVDDAQKQITVYGVLHRKEAYR